MNTLFDYFDVKSSSKSKHAGIVDGILQAINDDCLQVGDMLPSVNKFMSKLGVARMTVVKAMDELKSRGIIESKNRVGYFVRSENVTRQLKIMLFLTSFDAYHEILYKEITSGLNLEDISIDLFFHHCNPAVFRAVIKEHLGLYGLYIVTPFRHPSVKWVLNEIPRHKLLQVTRPPMIEGTSYISQNFDAELTNALHQIDERIKKYRHFRLIYPEKRGYPEEIQEAFSAYCKSMNLSYSIEKEMDRDMIREGTAFFTLADNDLIKVVKFTEENGLQMGKDIGIISYNETPMKEIIRKGITVVSTDFREVGMEIREFIETRRPVRKNIPTRAILRNSL